MEKRRKHKPGFKDISWRKVEPDPDGNREQRRAHAQAEKRAAKREKRA